VPVSFKEDSQAWPETSVFFDQCTSHLPRNRLR